MLKPKPMSKLTVFGPKTYLKKVIETLYEMDVVHIEDYTKREDEELFDLGEPFPENEKYAQILLRLRSLISNLNIKKRNAKPSKLPISLIEKKSSQISDQANRLLNLKSYLSELIKIHSKNRIEKALDAISLESNLAEKSKGEIKKTEEQGGQHDNNNSNYKGYVHFIGFINNSISQFKESLEKITRNYILKSANYSGLTLIALFVEPKKKDSVLELIEKNSFSVIDNPLLKEKYSLESEPGIKFVKFGNELKRIEKELEKTEKSLEELKQEHTDFILEAEKKIMAENEKAEAPLRFASTKNTFLIKGWIPNMNKKKLKKALEEATSNKVMIEFQKPSKNDNVPIAFNHPKLVKPFEAFMDLYSLPSYKEIDPTFFMFLTFPVFFGFMLGDVGYGLVILGLFLLLKKKMPGAKNFLNAFIIAALVSILFGVVFGEYFGYEEVSPGIGKMLGIHPEQVSLHGETELIYPIPHLFSRSHGINDLLSIAVLFGITHVLIGLVIGFINVYKQHGLKHAFFEKAGWIMLFPTVIWLLSDFLGVITGYVADMLKMFVPPMSIMLGLAVLGIIVIVKGEGAKGAVELPAIISNILSYARLMAVGLASLSLALVINNLAGQMFHSGIIGIIFGIIILVLGHAINIALGILSPFLHSLRLHYVEFFTKFFHGGGRKYVSFGRHD